MYIYKISRYKLTSTRRDGGLFELLECIQPIRSRVWTMTRFKTKTNDRNESWMKVGLQAIGMKKPEKYQGFNGIRTRDLRDTGACDAQSNGSCCVCRFVTWASFFFALNAIQLMRMQGGKTLNKNDLNSVTDQVFVKTMVFHKCSFLKAQPGSAHYYVFVSVPPNLSIDQCNSTISPPPPRNPQTSNRGSKFPPVSFNCCLSLDYARLAGHSISMAFNGAETNCRIAHILGILLMNSCNTDRFLATTVVYGLSTLKWYVL